LVSTPYVRPDCRHYNGYKPCGLGELCQDCAHYEPAGVRILIIKLGAAGDVIRTTPLLGALRRRFAPCRITWLTDPVGYELLKNTQNIDRLLAWSWENCMILQGQAFDLVYNFDKEARALALADLICAPQKIGFAPGPLGNAYIYNEESLESLRLGLCDELKFRQNQKSATRIVFDMAGIAYHDEEYEIGLSKQAEAYGEQLRRLHGLNDGRPVIGLNTGCGEVFQTKQWTTEGFAGLIEILLQRGDCHVMLLGGPREEEFNAALMQRFTSKITDSGCRNSIDQFMGIVNACDFVVSADTMAMHIAIGLRKEVVAFFGSTCHQEIDLFGRGEKVVTDFACSPCYRKTCDKEITCMMALESTTIAAAINRRLLAMTSRK